MRLGHNKRRSFIPVCLRALIHTTAGVSPLIPYSQGASRKNKEAQRWRDGEKEKNPQRYLKLVKPLTL